MSSWHEPQSERADIAGFIVIAIVIPCLFVAAFFTLNWALEQVARWFA